jgi:hypothetical protein
MEHLPSGATSKRSVPAAHWTQTRDNGNGTYTGWCKCGWFGSPKATRKDSVTEQVKHRAGSETGPANTSPREVDSLAYRASDIPPEEVRPQEADSACIGICAPGTHAMNCPANPRYGLS